MRALLFITLSTLFAMDIFSQNSSGDREPVVAGRFYSADKDNLKKDLSQFFTTCVKAPEEWKVRAIISPHAGYIFSGKTAASAFSSIPKNTSYKNIFIIGSSHIMAFEGASVYNTGDFITPLGKIKVNSDIANKLKNENSLFRFPVTAHLEDHCIEVQIPFIQYYFTNVTQIVPIIIGTSDRNTIKSIAAVLKPWFTPDNLFIISSDFSHYPSYKDAITVDNATADAILSNDSETFLKTLQNNSSKHISGLATSMCGWTSGLTLLYLAAGDSGLEFKRISYCNSGDSPYPNKDQVVGYNAIALIEKSSRNGNKEANSTKLALSNDEADKLISIARSSIKTMLVDNKRFPVDADTIPVNLKKTLGAFVTLKIDSNLRGCIGRLISKDPLYDVVRTMSLASAFEDPRFPPLTREEFDKIDIEISVIGPLRKINDISEIVIGKHGIYIKKDFQSGIMLPQVATEHNWTVEEFLGYTSRDKAGLGWLGWKDAEIFVFEAMILEENKK